MILATFGMVLTVVAAFVAAFMKGSRRKRGTVVWGICLVSLLVIVVGVLLEACC